MQLDSMLNLQQLTQSNNLQGAGTAVGGLIGGAFGAPMTGAAIGGAVGGIASALMPQYNHVRGSVSGFNFVNLGMKPYQIKLVIPQIDTARAISNYYCYYGCKTSRREALNIPGYIYQNHAYVKGDIEYTGSIPMDKFQKIKDMFAGGVHILGS